MDSVSELHECRSDYRSAARSLAAEAIALADSVIEGSEDLIDCRFARIRAAYAKCKGAHAALLNEATELADAMRDRQQVAR